MCLEMFNSLIGVPFACLGLALTALLVACLAALYLMRPRKKTANNQPSPGFTCPCYAPPYIHSENEQ
jgi:hypothetical protein